MTQEAAVRSALEQIAQDAKKVDDLARYRATGLVPGEGPMRAVSNSLNAGVRQLCAIFGVQIADREVPQRSSRLRG